MCIFILCTYIFVPTTQGGYAPLHLATMGGHTTCVEYLLFTPGIDVNMKDEVSCSDISSAIHILHMIDLPGSCYRQLASHVLKWYYVIF